MILALILGFFELTIGTIFSHMLFSKIIELADEKKEELTMSVLECNENNKDLYFARTKNGVGSKFYKIFEYDNFYQHLVL